ncbi:WD40 repeat-like protein [Fomitiporia mediterranea MF3/22]|uniref:WD40 repeat-like protein n=1 Tax=Fomitiporia mediterranea (strain MF3/22) TaxID=694068 RepID=UPI0004407B94|nr:WD40 repeat-like protein [Fomitiporia mediterranea MF3/22]EJD02917.1 WD40 repeat-like protein [Fomitiporia mediterranea MF3/22]
MANKMEKRLLWHPRQENRFIIGGGSQISLFDWAPDVTEFKLVSTQADLQLMKCFAWSPDPSIDDLVAVGSENGKVDLWRLEANRYARNNLVSNGPELSIRNSRRVLALAFSSHKPNLLAVGLDKVKGDPSLVIRDIAVAAAIAGRSSNARSSKADRSIVQQYALAEAVYSTTFLSENPNLLVAGISNLWLRLFDLRNPTVHIGQAPAGRVYGIIPDPFDKYRVACFGEGSVTVWDTRRFISPLLSFTLKDAAADGARYSSSDSFVNAEFSPVRRGSLATLTRDANHVRFWDIQKAPSSEMSRESGDTYMRGISKDSARSSKLSRLSWAAPSTMLPWNAPSDQAHIPSSISSFAKIDTDILSNTRHTKAFSRPLVSFALAPSLYDHPLTSNIVVTSKEGDIEMYEMHDVPKQTIWSSRGDLALGAGTSFRIFPGCHDEEPVPEPWELERQNDESTKTTTSRSQSRAEDVDRLTMKQSRRDNGGSDIKGSPATTARRLEGRTYSPASVKRYPVDHSVSRPPDSDNRSTTARAPSSEPTAQGVDTANRLLPGKAQRSDQAQSTLKGRRRLPDGVAPSAIESDISMLMRARVLQGYGLFNPQHNAKCTSSQFGADSSLSEVWAWLNHSRNLLMSGTSKIHGIDFSFQGILGIWEGLEASASPDVVSILDGLDLAGPSEVPSPNLLSMNPLVEANIPLRSRISRHSQRMGDGFHGSYSAALSKLNSRSNLDRTMWKPTVHTDKSQQRRLSLALCDWKVGEEEFSRWEREGKHSQAACWLLFTNQGARAIELLMRSKNESHQMLSGTIATLLQSGTTSRNHDLRGHCERLIVKLQDPHQRIMLSYIVFNDWNDVLEEEALPLRERLAIALRFLDDKQLTSYLRRIADDCRSKGSIEGLIVTGLTPLGLDVLQSYVDSTGDVQTVALLSSYICPGRYKDVRAERWVEAYRDLLDGWKLFHHRCQFDIDRGKILQEGILNGDFEPMEWVKKQYLIRCNFCNKVVNTQQHQRPQEPIAMQRRRAAACPWCGRALPRCAVCLMSVCVIPDTGLETDALHSSFRDTIDDAFVFCQKCRHGGHASHIIFWFFKEDGTRRHRTCPVADCDCYCDEDEDS